MPRNRIFVDTSACYAIIDKNDQDHTAALDKIRILDRPLLTSNYILDEILTLLKARLGSPIAIPFGQKLWNKSYHNGQFLPTSLNSSGQCTFQISFPFPLSPPLRVPMSPCLRVSASPRLLIPCSSILVPLIGYLGPTPA
jgi:hypothetical protein